MQICITVDDDLFVVLEQEKGDSRSAFVSQLMREALTARGHEFDARPTAGLTLRGAAEAAHVSHETIRAAIRRGELPARAEKFRYYIREDDLRAWMDGRA